MARYSLYPGFIKIRYTGNGHVHYQTIPVRPFVAVGGGWWLEQKLGGAGDPWADSVNDYVLLLKPFLGPTDEIQVAHLWTMASEDAEPVFQEEHNIAVAGTAGGAGVAYGQVVFTMRTTLGGLARVYIMEGVNAVNAKLYPPFGAGPVKSISDFIKGDTSFFVGRDGAFLSSVVSYTSKTNDALRKKYLLAQ
jgi:hypothetical protein